MCILVKLKVTAVLTRFRHIFLAIGDREDEARTNVDQFMDSYARDITVDELNDVHIPGPQLHSRHPANRTRS